MTVCQSEFARLSRTSASRSEINLRDAAPTDGQRQSAGWVPPHHKLDTKGLKGLFLVWLRGGREHCKVVAIRTLLRMPSVFTAGARRAWASKPRSGLLRFLPPALEGEFVLVEPELLQGPAPDARYNPPTHEGVEYPRPSLTSAVRRSEEAHKSRLRK